MLKIGTTIIHPAYGVCRISGIINSDPKAKDGNISYVLKPNKNLPGDFKIFIDESQIVESGARKPATKEKLQEACKLLSKKPEDLSADSKIGYPKTEQKLKSGDICSVAEALRDLEYQSDRLFSSKKKALIESANNMLLEEISYVDQVKRSEAKKIVMKALRKI